MPTAPTLDFAQPDLLDRLADLDDPAFDALAFGVIAFDRTPDAHVVRYNATESRGSGLAPDRVLGLPLFAAVAQCMNNYLVAQHFEDALADGSVLDRTLPYVFTLRMRPTPVVLRLLAGPGSALRYVAVQRTT